MKLSEAIENLKQDLVYWYDDPTEQCESFKVILEALESQLNYERLQEQQGSGERISKEWLRRKINEDKEDGQCN